MKIKETRECSSQGSYCITRIDDFHANDANAPRWAVIVKRQGVTFARAFNDNTYCGKQSAHLMAQAYRDALMRLVPPYTRRDLSAKRRANNKSGIPGVSTILFNGKIKAWRATLSVCGETHTRYFPIREHGDRAKELAIAARQELLAQYPSQFATFNAGATQIAEAAFPGLLQPCVDSGLGTDADGSMQLDKAALHERRDQLNAWFDDLRPQIVCVRVSVYQISRRGHTYEGLFVTVGDGESSSKRAREVKSKDAKSWMLKRRPYEKALRLAWPYIQDRVTERFGVHCWNEFKDLYRTAVFASTPDKGLFIRHRYDRPGGQDIRNTPPALLAPLLSDFCIPELPPQEQAVLVS